MLARVVTPALMVGLCAMGARAASAETIVLIAPPPALTTAVRTSLAPWRIDVVVVARTAGAPEALAAAQQAGFVAWREGDDLVFWDTARSQYERRPMATELDEASAAALALSIKTWMRLGPPPTAPNAAATSPTAALAVVATPTAPSDPGGRATPDPIATARPRWRVEIAGGARANIGDQGGAALRLGVTGLVRAGPFDVGLALELGPGQTVAMDAASGSWTATTIAAQGRWPLAITPAITVAPAAGLALVQVKYQGIFGQQQAFAASATTLGLDGSLHAEWRRSGFVAGVELGLSVLPFDQRLRDRAVSVEVSTHIEPRAMLRAGLTL